MCGPRGLPFSRNRLFHNDGRGHFEDVSVASGIARPARCYGFTVVASDFDDDGYPDLYVACDSTPSLLYHNLRNGTFEETASSRVAPRTRTVRSRAAWGSRSRMTTTTATSTSPRPTSATTVRTSTTNSGDGTLEDRVFRAGLGGTMDYVGWGIHLFDVDHDGRRELLMVHGHVYPEVDQNPELHFRQPRLLYWNAGGGRFKDVSSVSGPGIRDASWSSRGSAVGDLDNDGSLEVVINFDKPLRAIYASG